MFCERFGISLERSHSADADAGATLLLLWKFMVTFPERFEGARETFWTQFLTDRSRGDQGRISDQSPIRAVLPPNMMLPRNRYPSSSG